jgi:hypothetical protein
LPTEKFGERKVGFQGVKTAIFDGYQSASVQCMYQYQVFGFKFKMKTMTGIVCRCDVRALACSIAGAVTVESTGEDAAIAKNGEGCLFSIFRDLLPEVLRLCTCRLRMLENEFRNGG